jgi:thiamine biosynthesis protein ThiS
MVQIQINGETRDVADQSTLEDLVRELSLQPQRIAIELNHNVVRRNEWSETVLNSDDRIEIVHFVGGGQLEARP